MKSLMDHHAYKKKKKSPGHQAPGFKIWYIKISSPIEKRDATFLRQEL